MFIKLPGGLRVLSLPLSPGIDKVHPLRVLWVSSERSERAVHLLSTRWQPVIPFDALLEAGCINAQHTRKIHKNIQYLAVLLIPAQVLSGAGN